MSHELSSLITVLLQASGAEVVEWDAAEVETAIDWAIFFEKRYADRAGSAADKADAASTDASLRRLASVSLKYDRGGVKKSLTRVPPAFEVSTRCFGRRS